MRLPRHLVLPAVAAAGAALYVQKVHRFRDPVRFAPTERGAVLSPGDGLVSFVRRVDLGRIDNFSSEISALLDAPGGRQDGWLIGIAVRPLDVRYVYQPIGGKVSHVRSRGAGVASALAPQQWAALSLGQPLDLLKAPATLGNERFSYTIESDLGDVTVATVSLGGKLDMLNYVQEGVVARPGTKAAFLPGGGLVLVYLPMLVTPAVEVGQQVRGAETVLARRKRSSGL